MGTNFFATPHPPRQGAVPLLPQEKALRMSDKYIKHPSELFKTGDVIEVKIKDVDLKKNRIALTRKGMNVK